MPSTIKKSFCIVIIGLIWLLPISLRGIQAQQATVPSAVTGPSANITTEELQSRRAAIAAMVDIDAAVKSESLKYIDQAISHIANTRGSNNNATDLSELIQTAPERLKKLQAEMKKPFTTPEQVGARARQMSTSKLEQRVLQKEAEFAAAANRLDEWRDRYAKEKNAIKQAPEELAIANSRLKDIQTELETTSDATDTDILNSFRILSLQTEREKLAAEIKLNEMRQRSQNLLVELFSTEIDVAQKAVESRRQILKIWQTEVQKHRQEDAAQTLEDAQGAITDVPLLPKIVQEQFDINIELSAELEKITGEETALTKSLEDDQSRLKALEEEFDTAKKRVESAVLTDAIGLALRSQRQSLPGAGQYYRDSDARQIRMSEISERQIKLDLLLRELSDPKALAENVIGSISFLSNVDRTSLDLKIQELITNRLDILHKVEFGYGRIFKLIQDIEFTEQKIVNTAEDFGKFLDRHLLWIRSSKPVHINDIHKLKVSIGWLFKPTLWGELFTDMGRSFRKNTGTWIIGILIALYLIVGRRSARHKLKDIAECVEQQVEDSFWLTIKALWLTVALAAVWPFLLAFPAIQLINLRQATPFSSGIAGGLIYASRPLIVMALFYHICRPYGLAQAHFLWQESARRTLRNNLGWLTAIVTISSFFLGAMQTAHEFDFGDALAKFALAIQTLAIFLFVVRTLRFKGGITSILIEKYPQSWLSRLRYIWYPLAILLPFVILCLALIGYYYSAMEIRSLGRNTVGLFSALIIFNELVLRMLMLARRRIAIKKAIANQDLRQESAESAETTMGKVDSTQPSMMESIIEMSKIDEQTRKLLQLILLIFALAGIWAIWEPVFPAFAILQEIQFWSYGTVVDGVATTVPITLANISLAIVVVVTTIIASRNLPGLLEVILLNRLPMDPGARYAYSTVCRYAITAIGIIIAFNSIGIRWASLQWLVAALSVGIGFGLQEIVANFICGLIVLFERPFRVGDTVTIGDVNGTVSRIRIRATTVVDWDNKELIVPNKEFVVGRLINWSLTDKLIRFKVPVGIAYGSDTDLAEKLLLKVAKTNTHVLRSPSPKAVFLRFGDNSLDFELRVYINNIDNWIPMLHSINRNIDKEFRKAGITIAFPQRDMHLDTTGPLDVRMVMEGSASGDITPSPATPKEPES